MTDVPQIHLINLDRSANRLQLFMERNGHLSDVVRVPAFDGATLDLQELIASGYITADLPYTPGAIGCAMSHIRLWEMAVAQDRSLTIFEDDIVVSHQFEKKAAEVLSMLPPDWDLVQWGYSLNPLFVWVDWGVSKVRLAGYGARHYESDVEFSEFQVAEFSTAALRLLHSFGTFGYSISKKGAREVLKYCLPMQNRLIRFDDAGVVTPDVGIDVSMCGLYPSLNAYICVPQLLIHNDRLKS